MPSDDPSPAVRTDGGGMFGASERADSEGDGLSLGAESDRTPEEKAELAADLSDRVDSLEGDIKDLRREVETIEGESEEVRNAIAEVEETIETLENVRRMIVEDVNPFVDQQGSLTDVLDEKDLDILGIDPEQEESQEEDEFTDIEADMDEAEAFFSGDTGAADGAFETLDEDAEGSDASDDPAFQPADEGEVPHDDQSEREQQTEREDIEQHPPEETVPGDMGQRDDRASETDGQIAEETRSNQAELDDGSEQAPTAYLPHVPPGLRVEELAFEWAAYLIRCAGVEQAKKAADTYATIGWIGDAAAADLKDKIDMQAAVVDAGEGGFAVADHRESLAYIAQMTR